MKTIYLVFIFIFFLSSCIVERTDKLQREYPQAINQSIMRVYFPNQVNGSIRVCGESQLLVAKCPVVTTNTKYIYVDFQLKDSAISDSNVALYNVFIEKKENRKKEKWIAVTDNYYFANSYNRQVRIKNVYPVGEYRMWYGFYLKSDSLNPHPTLHKRVCHFEVY